jgi:hypothetical protein
MSLADGGRAVAGPSNLRPGPRATRGTSTPSLAGIRSPGTRLSPPPARRPAA